MDNTQDEARKRGTKTPGRVTHEVYRLSSEPFVSPKYVGSLPEDSDIRRDIRAMYGSGRYNVKTKQGGKFKAEKEVELLPEPLPAEPVFDDEPEVFTGEESEPEPADLISSGYSPAEVENLLLRERLKRMESEMSSIRDSANTSQSEALIFMKEMQKQSDKAFEQGLQMAQLLTQSNAPKQPEKSVIEQLSELMMLNSSVRQFSEDLNPAEKKDGNMLDSAGNLLDSVGDLIPKVAPFVAPVMSSMMNRVTNNPVTARQPAPANNVSLSELGNKVKNKRAVVNEEQD